MKDLELSNVEMLNFIITTVATLITCSVAIVLTDRAQQEKHDDDDGRFYYIGTCVAGLAYTLGNVILRINGIL